MAPIAEVEMYREFFRDAGQVRGGSEPRKENLSGLVRIEAARLLA